MTITGITFLLQQETKRKKIKYFSSMVKSQLGRLKSVLSGDRWVWFQFNSVSCFVSLNSYETSCKAKLYFHSLGEKKAFHFGNGFLVFRSCQAFGKAIGILLARLCLSVSLEIIQFVSVIQTCYPILVHQTVYITIMV